MYTPKHFRVKDVSRIVPFLERYNFVSLISTSRETGEIKVSHIPVTITTSPAASDSIMQGNAPLSTNVTIRGHLARANPQWRAFDDKDVACVFNGPHTHVSASWYNHENVPTWNYCSVHCHGKARLVKERAESVKVMSELVTKHEGEDGFRIDSMSEQYANQQFNRILPFEVVVSRCDASFKLSQNRDLVNHKAIIDKLRERGSPDDIAIASLMEEIGIEGIA